MSEHPTPRAITREDLSTLNPGDRVCVVGFGTASPVHHHATVVKLTKLYINTTWKARNGRPIPERHRIDNGHSTPRGDGYGGTTLHKACKRPKAEK